MTLDPMLIPMLAAKDPVSHVIPHDIIGPFHNQLLMGIVATCLVAFALAGLANRLNREKHENRDYVVKGTLWQLLETICVFVRDYVARPNLGKLTDKYIPYLWTVFFFILFCNVLGMIPFGPLAGLIASGSGADYPELLGALRRHRHRLDRDDHPPGVHRVSGDQHRRDQGSRRRTTSSTSTPGPFTWPRCWCPWRSWG